MRSFNGESVETMQCGREIEDEPKVSPCDR